MQKVKAEALIAELNTSKAFDNPVVTTIRPLEKFYDAEDYHQKYYDNHKNAPYCQIVIAPKLAKLQEKFERLLK